MENAEVSDENQFNDYATRKTIAQGFMDVALISANGYQLKAVLTKHTVRISF